MLTEIILKLGLGFFSKLYAEIYKKKITEKRASCFFSKIPTSGNFWENRLEKYTLMENSFYQTSLKF